MGDSYSCTAANGGPVDNRRQIGTDSSKIEDRPIMVETNGDTIAVYSLEKKYRKMYNIYRGRPENGDTECCAQTADWLFVCLIAADTHQHAGGGERSWCRIRRMCGRSAKNAS